MRLALVLLLLVSAAVAEDNAGNKFPVPAESELNVPYEVIDEVFGDQINAAKDAQAKSELAMKFLTTASTASDRFEKYALLEQAQTLALEANDLQLYFRTLDTLGETFQIDKVKLWSDQLVKLMDGQADETTLRQLAEIDFTAIDDPTKRNDAADAWYDFSQTRKGPAAQIAKERAVLHYQAAMPGLQGLMKLRSQKRMQECMEDAPTSDAPSATNSKVAPRSKTARYGHGRVIEVDCTQGLTGPEAQKSQTNAARAYGVPVKITNQLGMSFCFIPAGTFLMGSPENEANRKEDEKQQVVKISTPFYMGMTEVTQEQYWKVTGQKPSHFQNLPNHPVEMITWDAAKLFCEKLSSLDDKRTYRLPTKEQWEYACRAGTLGPTYGPLDQIAWYVQNSKETTQAVGMLTPNAWRLYDCLGNVWEWCDDTPAQFRGGCWWDPDNIIRAGMQHPADQNKTRKIVGFRVLFIPDP